jgi:pimeloyl-ACP methyl ester carboxylesterase
MEMYYEAHGQGEPLVLLHDFTGYGGNWGPFLGAFSKDYRVIVPDLRGHGRSTNPPGQFTFRQSALDIFALVDSLGIDRFKAIGMSAGAKTLLHMATQQPHRVEAMALVSATPYFPEQARAIMGQMTAESRTEQEWQMMRQWHQHGDEQIRMLWAQGNAFKDSYDDMNFTPPYLSTIAARTLIVHGDHDPLYPVRLAVEMYTAIPHASLWVVPNGGHGPIFGEFTGDGETTGRFADAALKFLRGDAWNSSR